MLSHPSANVSISFSTNELLLGVPGILGASAQELEVCALISHEQRRQTLCLAPQLILCVYKEISKLKITLGNSRLT